MWEAWKVKNNNNRKINKFWEMFCELCRRQRRENKDGNFFHYHLFRSSRKKNCIMYSPQSTMVRLGWREVHQPHARQVEKLTTTTTMKKKKKNQHHGRPQILFASRYVLMINKHKWNQHRRILHRHVHTQWLLEEEKRKKGFSRNQIVVACAKENQENRCECR